MSLLLLVVKVLILKYDKIIKYNFCCFNKDETIKRKKRNFSSNNIINTFKNEFKHWF